MEGYSPISIFFVLAIGLSLAVWRPYRAFLFSTLLIVGGHAFKFNVTRTELLGPYFNLGDACMLVALAALLLDCFYRKESLRMPKVTFFLLLILTAAAIQSLMRLGWTYETRRAYRWGLQFPLVFLISANLVITPKRTRRLLIVLAAGAFLAALQHMWHVATVRQTAASGVLSP